MEVMVRIKEMKFCNMRLSIDSEIFLALLLCDSFCLSDNNSLIIPLLDS